MIFYDLKSQRMIFLILCEFYFGTLLPTMSKATEIQHYAVPPTKMEVANFGLCANTLQCITQLPESNSFEDHHLQKICKDFSSTPYFKSSNRDFTLLHGDTFKLLPEFSFKFDMIFADPPYFLSNGGISVQSGKIVCVDKGKWDKGLSPREMHTFNHQWLALCRDKMKDNATIWVSGTYHNIFSVANCMSELGYKILNCVTWAKTNPPPNISCRYFTYSTEFIIWARKTPKRPHFFDYEMMKHLNGNKQMTDVWNLPAIARWEKSCGKHPTQKPLALLSRIILASTKPGAWILDPFAGSSTTGIAANLLGRRYLGIEQEQKFVEISKARRLEIEDVNLASKFCQKIKDIKEANKLTQAMVEDGYANIELPF